MTIAVIILAVVVVYFLWRSVTRNRRIKELQRGLSNIEKGYVELKDHIEQQKQHANNLEAEVTFLRSALLEMNLKRA